MKSGSGFARGDQLKEGKKEKKKKKLVFLAARTYGMVLSGRGREELTSTSEG